MSALIEIATPPSVARNDKKKFPDGFIGYKIVLHFTISIFFSPSVFSNQLYKNATT